MRVIAGTARGHLLTAPKGMNTRPTADRMKEDLFNILSPRISDAVFLDLYCGSGAIGIEALSRGAQRCVFADASKDACAAASANLIKTRLNPRAEIMRGPVLDTLARLSNRGETFSVIFLDPPYDSAEAESALGYIARNSLLATNGIAAAELPAGKILPVFERLSVFRRKEYSRTQFVFFTSSL